MPGTNTTLASDAEVYDAIVEVVGDESSLEFVAMVEHLLDGNGADIVMRDTGVEWERFRELTEQVEARLEDK